MGKGKPLRSFEPRVRRFRRQRWYFQYHLVCGCMGLASKKEPVRFQIRKNGGPLIWKILIGLHFSVIIFRCVLLLSDFCGAGDGLHLHFPKSGDLYQGPKILWEKAIQIDYRVTSDVSYYASYSFAISIPVAGSICAFRVERTPGISVDLGKDKISHRPGQIGCVL